MPMKAFWPQLLMIVLLLFGNVAAAFAAAPKNQVALFKYRGVIPQHTSSSKFENFRSILDDKIANLKREVLQGDSEGFDYLKDISISYREQDSFTNASNIERWLDNQVSVLCLLRGTIISDDNVTYLVKSNFYLGHLKGYFPYDVIRIELPVLSSEFGNTKDSHSLVILYALAMDAKRLGQAKDHIALFLTAATNKLADIKRRSGGLSGDLVALEQAIAKATDDLLGGGNGS